MIFGKVVEYKLLKFIVLLFIGALAVWVWQKFDFKEPSFIVDYILSYGYLAPIAYVVIKFLLSVVFLPVLPLTIAGGILFGVTWGTVLGLIAQTLGGVVALLIVRQLGEQFVEVVFHRQFGRFAKYKTYIEDNGFKSVLLLRLMPMPANVVNIVVGLSKIKIKPFMFATILGSIPGTAIYAYMGASFYDKDKTGIGIALLLTGLLSIFGLYFKNHEKKRRETVD